MKLFFLCSLMAFCISSFLMPFAIKLSKRFGAFSDVGGRHVGANPIGRFGGFGIVIGVFLTVVCASCLDSSFSASIHLYRFELLGVFVGVLVVGGAGFIDDVRRLPASTKFFAQVISALLAYFSGIRISGVDLPGLGVFQLGVLSLPITVVWIVGIVNAVNLIDGLDGLAGGVIIFAAIVNLVAGFSSGAIVSAALMSALAGAGLGFLIFNWHPARIYLGDGGAYSVGYLLATSALLAPLQKASTSVALLVPILSTGLPIFDTILAMVRRFVLGHGIFSPDRGHLHHVLFDAGISHRKVVLGLYLISCVMGSVALLIVLKRETKIGYFLVGASLIGSVIWGISVRNQLMLIVRRVLRK